jgi:hypothetical protein
MTLKFFESSQFYWAAPWIVIFVPTKIDRISEIDAKQVGSLLYPLLKADDQPTLAEMLVATKPLLESVLDHNREAAYLAAIAEGKYQPELLFPERTDIAERIREHPALIWKADNVARHLKKSKKT